MDFENKECPVVKVDGFIEKGKQFDIEINLPEDNRNAIFGVIRDCYKDPVEDAVVKLIEVCKEYGKEERKPVSHTFTDKDGEFVFGPLCPDKQYEIQFWADRVKHVKICADCKRTGKCLKGVKIECKKDRPYYDEKSCYDKKYDYEEKSDYDKKNDYDEKPCCDKKYDYDEKSDYDKKDDYDKKPCCDKKHDYDEKSDYDKKNDYDKKPCCDKKHDDDEKPCCDKKHDYDEKPCDKKNDYEEKPCYDNKRPCRPERPFFK